MDFNQKSNEELYEMLSGLNGSTLPLLRPRVPQLPILDASSSVQVRLSQIQQFISSFEYNHTGVEYIKKRKDRGNKHVMTTAREIIKEALPIQCVEAVFVAVYLTAPLQEVCRFPLSFKSKVQGRHIDILS